MTNLKRKLLIYTTLAASLLAGCNEGNKYTSKENVLHESKGKILYESKEDGVTWIGEENAWIRYDKNGGRKRYLAPEGEFNYKKAEERLNDPIKASDLLRLLKLEPIELFKNWGPLEL